ncbi:F-box/RNI-like/FBD-like domains-containing protein [Rhynchospora pubera]|uniref:F-box/RNI-like/FBD-like domains-containing protein n=1 Tax=Rhynchospora pubera TaxID=906938 RepID=A0AAV8FJT3_9POAL|nr:F-box/RNI-like/FBD-like domains-containing protein [Rhynchospora pubera]
MERINSINREKKKMKGIGDHHSSGSPLVDDPINSLSDCLIESILSLLPLKDAARASLVSTRWRTLWTSAPLCIDDSSLHRQPSAFSTLRSENAWCRQAVFDIISKHQGPIQSCRLTRFDHPLFHVTVDRLLKILVDKHIQQLSLSFSNWRAKTGYLLPDSFFSCKTLLKLKLYICCLPKIVSPPIFPRIKEVVLTSVSLLDDSFITHLLSSSSLEKLHIYKCTGYQCIVVSSPNLMELVVTDRARLFGNVKEVTIESAPNLKNLVLSETATMGTVVSIKHAPKLALLGFICLDLVKLQIGGGTFKRESRSSDIVLCGPRTLLPSVKSLAVIVNFSDEKQILLMSSILQCFPFLETLDVKLVNRMTVNETNMEAVWVEGGPFSFLNHLKQVTLKGFSEHRAVVAFANFLILNALVLKEIALLCSTVDLCYKKNWVEERCRELRYKERSSPLKIEFLEDWVSHPKFAAWNLVLD